MRFWVQALERGADDSGLPDVRESRQYKLLVGWRDLFTLCEEGLSRAATKALWDNPDLRDQLREIGLGVSAQKIEDVVFGGMGSGHE